MKAINTIRDLEEEVKRLKIENIKLKREKLGLETTVEHFREKEEKRYGQLNGGSRYEKQKDYHKR